MTAAAFLAVHPWLIFAIGCVVGAAAMFALIAWLVAKDY